MQSRAVVVAVTVAAVGLVMVPGRSVPAGRVSAGAGTDSLAWGPVTRLAPNPRGESLAVDAAGTVTVAWATSSTPPSVVVRRHPSDGGWGKPVVIGHGYAPQAAVDGRGNVTIAWLTQRQGFTDGVVAARRPVGGPWSAPVRLSHDLSVPGYPHGGEDVYGATDLDLAVSPHGATVAVWAWGSDDRSKPWRIQSAFRPAGAAWTGPEDVTPAGWAREPRVGLDAHGNAVLVYGRQPFGHPQVLKARLRTAAGGWTRPAVVAREGYTHSLAVDRAGNAVVVFTPDFGEVWATYRPADGRWGRARGLSPAGVGTNDFALAMNGRGAAVVAFARDTGRVDLVRRPPGGPWSGAVAVAARGSTTVSDVLVALNGSGDTFVGWGGYALFGRYRPHDGAWSSPSTISPDAGVEVLEETHGDLAPNGDVAVLWEQEARPLKVRLMTSAR
jgi:hypothetical protein